MQPADLWKRHDLPGASRLNRSPVQGYPCLAPGACGIAGSSRCTTRVSPADAVRLERSRDARQSRLMDPITRFNVRRLPRRSRRRHDLFDGHRLYPRTKGNTVHTIPISDHSTVVLGLPRKGLPDLLRGPTPQSGVPWCRCEQSADARSATHTSTNRRLNVAAGYDWCLSRAPILGRWRNRARVGGILSWDGGVSHHHICLIRPAPGRLQARWLAPLDAAQTRLTWRGLIGGRGTGGGRTMGKRRPRTRRQSMNVKGVAFHATAELCPKVGDGAIRRRVWLS